MPQKLKLKYLSTFLLQNIKSQEKNQNISIIIEQRNVKSFQKRSLAQVQPFKQNCFHEIRDKFFFFLIIQSFRIIFKERLQMGNDEVMTKQYDKTSNQDIKTCAESQDDIQQKNMTIQYDQDQNPLKQTFQKGILNNSIIASNNKLIDSHKCLSSTHFPKKSFTSSKPRVSLELKLLSRQNLQKLKKISNKVVEQGSIENDLSFCSQKQNNNQVKSSQYCSFTPIYLSQENIIKIQETNINNKYKILHKIGQGGFGVVYKALCRSSQEQRAIKIVNFKNYSSFNKKLLQNQISMLLKMDHPNIIKIYEIVKFQSIYYIITEFCQGGTLCDYLNKNIKYKSEKFVKNIMKKLLSAVNYLHNKKIIHRDLKLDNIVVKNVKDNCQEELIIKIIDFGLSIQTSCSVVKSDKLIGTPQYLAPESIIGMHSLKSDIWSCGVIFYMLLIGQSPFKGATKSRTLTKIKNQHIDFRSSDWRFVSGYAKELLFLMLSKCTINRPTAKEALNHPWFLIDCEDDSLKALPNSQEIAKNLAAFEKKNNLISFIETYTCITKLSQQQRQKLIKNFNHIDRNKNGLIQLSQLKAYFQKNKIKLSDGQIKNVLKRIDLNQNQTIDLNEFICAVTNLQRYFEKEYISEIFNLFDNNHDGYIDRQQLKNRLSECQHEQINYLFRMIDLNNDKNISSEEFRNYLLKRRTARRSFNNGIH